MMSVHPDFHLLAPFIAGLPGDFGEGGTPLYTGRNELRLFDCQNLQLVVKSYRTPSPVNRVAYGWLRPSKAERAYTYALKLQQAGFGTPQPVGFLTCRKGPWFDRSYSVTLKSACPHTYRDLNLFPFKRRDDILQAIARFTARLHERGFLHADYSGGNILFDDTGEDIRIELVDLNRMRFGKAIDLEAGCRNFERLPGTDDMLEVMALAYAGARGFDPELCVRKIRYHVLREIKRRQRRAGKVFR
jgi:tRNA A-37 threonylcarbamoyl transferase component Bud32